MLSALIILHLTVLTIANPFHKYPYVFLLDVGNEELAKVNTEQIRISKQGGSLALRYPAIGNGEDIAHVRVTGIDFGTDLKANIVDGGPGYKYVVLVLMGNPGVAFDAVITVQTVPSENNEETSLQNIGNGSSNTEYQASEENDPNDSAEDLSNSAASEEASQLITTKENAELRQESSNVYSYAVNEALSGYGNKVHYNDKDQDEISDGDEYQINDSEEDKSEQKDIHVPNRENHIQQNSQVDDYTDDDESPSSIDNQSQERHNNDDYVSDHNYASDIGNEEQVNTNSYEEYQAFRQNMYNEGETYSQQYIPADTGTVYVEEPGDNGGPLNLEEIFSDEYDDEVDRKYSDTNNNNFIDRSDASAITY